jgi:large subunit GTPase 1
MTKVGRGYTKSGQGNPDEARSARYILKDYVNGKLLFCHPPPGISDASFNEPTHKNALVRVASKKQAPLTRVGKDSDTFISFDALRSLKENPVPGQSSKSHSIDLDFFEKGSGVSARPFIQENGKEFSRARLYPHQNIVTDNGIPIDPSQNHLRMHSRNMDKKHKKTKRVKQRSGKGYD